jgi:hypothetical protein
MKRKFSIHIVLSALALAAALPAGTASAHSQAGTLEKPAGATDLYVVSCFDDGNGPPARLDIRVLDVGPVRPPKVSAQTWKGSVATNSTDRVDGDSAFSRESSNEGGAGDYYVAVDKTRSGRETYTLDFHCMTAANAHTGTEIVMIQNQ